MPSDRPDSGVPLPRRPVLLPGLRVLRRGPDEVQIGLDPRRAVVLAATDAVRRTLAVLAVAGPPDQADPAVLGRLARLGLLVEHAGAPRPARGRVVVLGFGSSRMPDPADLIHAAGLDLGASDDADVGLLVGAGEPDRDLLDPWVRDGLPHLVVRVTEGVAVVGPFVAAGHTACLRCVDAHHTDADPRWPLLVAQQAAQTARARPDGVPEPVDPVLAGLALAWAVRDLASHAEGRRPATWSATLRLPPDLADGESVTWLRHPECGCSWNTVSEWAS